MTTTQRKRRPLTKQRILEKAIAVADKDGIEALSMRKLGQALGVEAMSLYKHVANKGELVAAMVDSVVEEFELPDDEPAWDVAIRRCAVRAHDLLIEHPWACGLALVPSDVRTIGGPRIHYMDWLLRRLSEAGFSPHVAYSAYHTIDSHIFGFTLWQLGHANATQAFVPDDGESPEEFFGRILAQIRPRYPHLAEHAEQHLAPDAPNGKQEFEFGLDLILEGLRRKASAGRKSR
jgi:AcrR family transcriptional regulator